MLRAFLLFRTFLRSAIRSDVILLGVTLGQRGIRPLTLSREASV